MSANPVPSPKKNARPRKVYGYREKPDLKQEREKAGSRYTPIRHSWLIDLWRILPPSAEACIVMMVLRNTVGYRNQEWSPRLGTAYFAEYAEMDQQTILYALADLIRRGVIAEMDNPDGKTPGSGRYKCLTEDWQRLAEENPYPRRKPVRSIADPDNANPDDDDLEDDEEETAPAPVDLVLLPPTTIRRGGKTKRLNLDTGARSVQVQVAKDSPADVASRVDTHGGHITVSVTVLPVPNKGRKIGEAKNADPVESIDSKRRSQMGLGSAGEKTAPPKPAGPAPGDQIQAELKKHGGPNAGAGDQMWKSCRQTAAGCTVSDVIVTINGFDLKSAKNPIAVLMRHVPLRVADAMLQREDFERKKREREQAKQPYNEREHLRNLRRGN